MIKRKKEGAREGARPVKKETARRVILLTGGSGLLGTELRKLDRTLIAPPRAEMDITDYDSVQAAIEKYKPSIVLHAAAATKPPEHEKNPELGIVVNIIGTANVARACLERGIRLVYTSSDYVYAGQGPHREQEPTLSPSKFITSKLGGEAAVALVPNALILRLSFGPVPFPWDRVYEGQYNSKLYVDEIAPLVLAAAKSDATGVMNIGGPRATLFEYARRTRAGITTIPKPDWVPEDTSLDVGRMRDTLHIANLWDLYKHKA